MEILIWTLYFVNPTIFRPRAKLHDAAGAVRAHSNK